MDKNISVTQMRAWKTMKEIENICIKNDMNLTIYEGKIGFVDPVEKKIVLLWDAEFKANEKM